MGLEPLPNEPLTSLHADGIYTSIGGRASSACWLNGLHDNPETRSQMDIGMYLYGFEKPVLPDINKRSSLGERLEPAET